MSEFENTLSFSVGGNKVSILYSYVSRNQSTLIGKKKSDFIRVVLVGFNEVNPLHYQPIIIGPTGGVNVDSEKESRIIYYLTSRLVDIYLDAIDDKIPTQE